MFVSMIDNFSIDKIEEVSNPDLDFKTPSGGLWASTYTPEADYVSSWHRFAKRGGLSIKDSFVLIDIKSDADIYTIDSIDDLNSLLDENDSLDFERLSERFDAIHLTKDGVKATSNTSHLYGWDVESLFIMNKDCINDYQYKEVK